MSIELQLNYNALALPSEQMHGSIQQKKRPPVWGGLE